MDNYEINILRRDGDWKKVNPNDRIMDSLEENEELEKKSINLNNKKFESNFLYYLNEVNSIIDKVSEITLLLEDIDQDIHEQNNLRVKHNDPLKQISGSL